MNAYPGGSFLSRLLVDTQEETMTVITLLL